MAQAGEPCQEMERQPQASLWLWVIRSQDKGPMVGVTMALGRLKVQRSLSIQETETRNQINYWAQRK